MQTFRDWCRTIAGMLALTGLLAAGVGILVWISAYVRDFVKLFL